MNESTQQPTTSTVNPSSFPLSFLQRLLYGFFVVVMPFVNFAFVKLLKPDWQSGRLPDYINLFLSPESSFLFFPLLAYSVVCYILLLINSDRYAGSFIVRFGIYTGIFLALQYSVLTILAVESSSSSFFILLAYFSPFIMSKLYFWLTTRWKASLVRNITLGLGITILFIAMIAWETPFAPFIFIAFFLGAVAPFWSFLISGQVALWLLKNHESKFTLIRGLGIAAWLSAYVYALRFDILKMYELYAALPTQPPNCYIATAAANGHPHIVCSQSVNLKNGILMQVNPQLQRLKVAELALMAIAPSLHKRIRKMYDVSGKRLATHIQNPLLADVAFLLLVPVEWVSFAILKFIIPEIEIISKKMYLS